MKQKIVLTCLLLTSVLFVFAESVNSRSETDVFFSEYIEGSSNNKALEIFNNTGATIDLSHYRIAQSSNGGGWAFWHTFPSGATLANNDVWVIATNEANSALQDAADEILAYPSVVHHNGNDARAIEYSSDGSSNWSIIDIIGEPDNNPGDGWSVAGVSNGTFNHTLVRKSDVLTGTDNWNNSAGTNADDSQWIVYPQDTFEYIGYHQIAGEDTTPPTLTNAVSQSSTTVKLSFSEAVTSASSTEAANYTITNLLIVSIAIDGANSVIIETTEQTENEDYTITVNNVEDLAGNQIEPNSQISFTGYTGPVYDQIATIRANYSQYEGQQVTVHGIITIGVNSIQTGRTNAYIQDNSGRGIAIYDPQVINSIQRGNEVILTGTVGQYQGTMQIQNPQVSILSEGNPEPYPYNLNLSNIGQTELEGTLLRVTGSVEDTWWAGGGTNLVIGDGSGTQMTVRVWDTTGIDVSEFIIGYDLAAIGVGSVYNNVLQLVPGYQDQLKEAGASENDAISFEPSIPEANKPLTFIYQPNFEYEDVYLHWKKSYQTSYTPVLMDSVFIDSLNVSTYQVTLPSQSQGTIIYYYLEHVIADDDNTFLPENAPAEYYQVKIPISSFKAVLNITPKPFNPFAGDKIELTFGSTTSSKAILRIYNSEGKLVATPYNGFINSSSGTQTMEWNGRDKDNKQLPIGLYIAYLEVVKSGSGDKKTAKAPIVIGVPLK